MTPKLSWGLTAINPDVADLFLEQVKDGNYLTNDGKDWAPLEVRTELIKVRFGSEVTLKVQKTRNGVILPPLSKEDEVVFVFPLVAVNFNALLLKAVLVKMCQEEPTCAMLSMGKKERKKHFKEISHD